MEQELRAFDESCAKLRELQAECIRRLTLRNRVANKRTADWLAWCKIKSGEEPIELGDNDIYRMLNSAYEAIDRQFSRDVHALLLHTHDSCYSVNVTVEERNDSLKWWQNRVLGWLLPRIQAMIPAPIRGAFSDEYPECLRLIVFDDVGPGAMSAVASMLDELSNGTLRFCANTVLEADDLLALCDSGDFAKAFAASWNRCIATARHESPSV